MPHNLQPNNNSIFLLEYLEILFKRKWLILKLTIVAAILSIVISLFLPIIYSAKTLIMPPQQDQGLITAMLGQLGGLSSIASDAFGSGTRSDLYVTILKSEAISDAIIDRFKLMKLFDTKYRLDTYKALAKAVSIESGKKDGVISVTVEDEDPVRAAEIANAYIEELNKLINRLSSSGAEQNKLFLEERLAKAKTDLAKAEDSIKTFQAKNKALDINEQAMGTIKGISDLESQLAIEEVKQAGLKRIYTDNSQEVRNQQYVIDNIKKQIAKFEGTRIDHAIPGIGSVPALGQKYIRLMREFKIQETLVDFLSKQYEMSKLSEEKNVDQVQVFQKARIPDKKTKPKRALIVVITTIIAFLSASFLSFILEAINRTPQEQKDRFRKLFSSNS